MWYHATSRMNLGLTDISFSSSPIFPFSLTSLVLPPPLPTPPHSPCVISPFSFPWFPRWRRCSRSLTDEGRKAKELLEGPGQKAGGLFKYCCVNKVYLSEGSHIKKKSWIRETLTRSMCANSSTKIFHLFGGFLWVFFAFWGTFKPFLNFLAYFESI